jgi:hypothetical protein
MRKFAFAMLCVLCGAKILSWENHDWILNYSWYLEMDDEGDYIYWHKTPHGEFKKPAIPEKSDIYRRRIRKDYFDYFYRTRPEQIFLLGYDRNNDGIDDTLGIYERENYSVMFIENREGSPLEGGDRLGGERLEGHPLVGIWGRPENSSELRLLEPADYIYSLKIERIPGFAIRAGTYLLKQIGDRVFETDGTFPDGHMRLEIRRGDLLVLTPLFTLPGEDGLVEPLFLRRIPKIDAR